MKCKKGGIKIRTLYFDLHGTYHTNMGSDPQDILPYLSPGNVLTLEAITDNLYDEYAVAVFYQSQYIGWIPKGENMVIHNLLLNNINISCSVNRTYETNKGYGVEIAVDYDNSYSSDFDPSSISQYSNANLNLSRYEIKFLKYLDGRSVSNPNIAQYWLNDYGIVYASTVKKLLEYGYIRISSPTEIIGHLKNDELKNILYEFDLPTTGKKSDLSKRIIDNLSENAIDDVTKDKDKIYVITEKSQPLLSYLAKIEENEETIKTLKNNDLKKILREYDLPVYGDKIELAFRIIENLSCDEIDTALNELDDYDDYDNYSATNYRDDDDNDEEEDDDEIDTYNNTFCPYVCQSQSQYSSKSRTVDLLLCIFFGYLGVHKYYEGKIFTGILYSCTFGLCYFGWIIDIILISIGYATDKQGNRIKVWY